MAEHFMSKSNDILNGQEPELIVKSNHKKRSIQQAQESIYHFLEDLIQKSPPEAVLQEFNRLFIQHINSASLDSLKAIYEIGYANAEKEFRQTINRSCYLLINNWRINRNNKKYINRLIEMFANPISREQSVSPTINRLRSWIKNFVNSNDYQELKLFASTKYQEKYYWSNRYTSYLLVPQSAELKKIVEQQETAQDQAKHLKEQFKFDPATYIAPSQSATVEKQSKNPIRLGNEVIGLIKTIVAKREPSSYANIANIFIKQTKGQKYKEFKVSLHNYLTFSLDNQECIDILNLIFTVKLAPLYKKYQEQALNDGLVLRTCNRVIDYLTTENHREPSPVFVLLMSQGYPMTLVIVLLKIILICSSARTHLEFRLGDLTRYYEDSSEEECNGMINFLDILNIIFAIYADNVSVQLDWQNVVEGGQSDIGGKSDKPCSPHILLTILELITPQNQ